MTDRHDKPPSRVGLRAGLVAAAVLVAAIFAIVLVGASSGDAPTAVDAARIANDGPTASGPAVDARHPALLDLAVDGVAFPAYRREFGWRATGVRRDHVDARATTTVFYERHAHRIAYTIVSGDRLDRPDDARVVRRGGVELASFSSGTAVTWERGSHTCVLTGDTLDVLLELASWRGGGAIAF
jgi:hypothetical protein